MTWMEDAACLGEPTSVFFDEFRYREAKRICSQCPVSNDCLEWALERHEAHGVFGGLSPRERNRLRRQRQSNRRRTLALLRSNDWGATA